MRSTLLLTGLLTAVVAQSACGNSTTTSNDGAAGNSGAAGVAGTAGAAGATQAFTAIDPCPTAADYTTGTMITVDPSLIAYTPKCLKVSAGASVTIGASAIHPLSGTTVGSANNPIPLHQMSSATVTFPTPGFYSFQCDVHFSVGMKGVVWVTP